MRVLSVDQPGATLCVTRQLRTPNEDQLRWISDVRGEQYTPPPMVQRFVTLPTLPDDWTGQRIALHATKRKPADGQVIDDYLIRRQGQGDIDYPHSDNYMRRVDQSARRYGTDGHLGDAFPLPLGAIIGSATVEACLPIVSLDDETDYSTTVVVVDPYDDETLFVEHPVLPPHHDDISDQLPFCDWSPGRYAVLLADAAPVQERCPNHDERGVAFDPWGTDHHPQCPGGGPECDRLCPVPVCAYCHLEVGPGAVGRCEPIRWVSPGGQWRPT